MQYDCGTLLKFFEATRGLFSDRNYFNNATVPYSHFNMSVRRTTKVLDVFLTEDIPSVDKVVEVGGVGAVLQALVLLALQILSLTKEEV
jgi:hypothetical protein